MSIYHENDIDGFLEFLKLYCNSLSDDKDIVGVEALIRYFDNKRERLLSYQEQIERDTNMQSWYIW
ncbi:MAG: hypothetical protein ACI39R_06790 [Lachnospiraceae bacterium]